ncbi:hypothetical protein QZH56_16120 [Streptomyces olivoreticuli]|uniref:hypothetical protein n=1 Tax=Streptomyces olivoreticuli TaxID=68246 RepID=UPI0026598136|nr:hypothetical protein [Streptomyces olivoreticuli]WKK26978.1 hypothetical protein QZH56_16120 [Streptomyces olivoreticuli]
MTRTKTSKKKRVEHYCGCCAGKATIWCPICCGFEGCATCKRTYRVECPACSGGELSPIRW